MRFVLVRVISLFCFIYLFVYHISKIMSDGFVYSWITVEELCRKGLGLNYLISFKTILEDILETTGASKDPKYYFWLKLQNDVTVCVLCPVQKGLISWHNRFGSHSCGFILLWVSPLRNLINMFANYQSLLWCQVLKIVSNIWVVFRLTSNIKQFSRLWWYLCMVYICRCCSRKMRSTLTLI